MERNEPLKNSISEICLICFETRSSSEFLPLECSHSFCRFCLYKDWQSKIKQSYLEISALTCPQENCGKLISLLHLKTLLPIDFYNKMEEICNKNSKVLNPSVEKSICCLKCEIRFDIWKDADYFTCPQCKKRYCAKCSHEHDNTMNCEEYQENKNKTPEEQEFYKMMKAQGYKKCPGCSAFVERSEGCNFIRCTTAKCNKKTCFCYLCGELLTAEDHYNHYVMSPWEGPCIKTAFEKDKNAKQEQQERKKEKDDNFKDVVACPKCVSFCKIDRGWDENGRFCVCEKICKKTFCLLCKKEASDKNFGEHQSGQCLNGGGVCKIF